jgi:hypothetical protein
MATTNTPLSTTTGGKDLKPLQNLPRTKSGSLYHKKLAEIAAAPPPSTLQKLVEYVPSQIAAWAGSYLKYTFQGKFTPFPVYPKGQKVFYNEQNGLYRLAGDSIFSGAPDPNETVRVSVAGDWGTGTDEAEMVANGMAASAPHFTIHLGDVYYVGDQPEMDENCLGIKNPENDFKPLSWPVGSVGGFALNGNHEMYAGGGPYFTSFFKWLGVRPSPGAAPCGQNASYFCLENDYWRIIAVDTGYNSVGVRILERIPLIDSISGVSGDCTLEDPIINWLQALVKPNGDNRGIILLSHHQYYSAFEQEYTKPSDQMKNFFNRQLIWFWGHEHRMAIYDGFQENEGIQAHGRCIGHGGMPVELGTPKDSPPWLVYDNRQYHNDEDIVVGYNGYVNLTFQGNKLTIDYRDVSTTDPSQNPLMKEEWTVDLVSGGLQRLPFTYYCTDPDFHHK